MDAKNILQSKTFWLNVIGLVTTLAGVLPEQYAVPILAILNVVNRFFTSQPVVLK